MGVLGKWQGQAWLWVALGLMVAIVVAMGFIAGNPMRQMRQMMGLPNPGGRQAQPAAAPAPMRQVLARAKGFDALAVATVGLGGLALITLLMVLKPF